MNILTFDIEEWFAEETIYGDRKEKYLEYDKYLGQILDTLDERKVKGTFFCVGGLVPKYDYVIKRIAKRGHEVGCHSNHHHFLNKMSYEEVLADTKEAVDSIEQLIGRKVVSYRAPAFSIGESNKWVFDILAECGIERDASVFPAARDFGGFSNFPSEMPCVINNEGHSIKEFPICMASVLNKRVAYSGGGYFRFFPLMFISSQMSKSKYAMAYFHIGDLIPESKSVMTREEYESYFKENGSLINRYKRFIKTNLGKKGAFDKMMSLIGKQTFISLEEADKQIDWSNVKQINL